VAIGLGLLFLPLGLFAGLSLRDAAVFVVGLLVANVPEGLLPTITLALAVGVRVLAHRGALVKRLSAVETLGSTTVICTDKTGTLTENKMRVVHLWMEGHDYEPVGDVEALRPLAQVMADCNDELTADPMEAALRTAANDLGVTPAGRLQTFRFDPRRKRMSVVTRRDAGLTVQVKGAPEQVLPCCTRYRDRELSTVDSEAISAAVEDLAGRGLRVLALASRPVTDVPASAEQAESALCLRGLVALLDPPRPEVADAVTACHDAGIRVHVVTGDHGSTATEIARQVGIRADRVVTGTEADAMAEPDLDALLAEPGEIVFARSTPEGKLRIAEALRHNGEVVAMTGDGVNDAPALHRADIGVAMGKSGTDVAREAATMVLTDDNFATIVTAVREGRRAYDNLRKFVLYIFAHMVPEVAPFAVFALSAGHIPLPLTVLQILAIDLGTETLPALALGRERAEPDVMDRPPRPRREHLITRRLLGRAWLVMGSISALLALGMYFAVLHRAGWHPGDSVASGTPLHHAYLQATTATFATIVACQLGTAFAARTERASLRAIGIFSNPLLLAGIAAEVVFTAALCYIPPLQDIFGTAALPGWVLPLLLPCPVIVWGADELVRWKLRRHASGRVPSRSTARGLSALRDTRAIDAH
jgi:calcium-translocating P-type ATPase